MELNRRISLSLACTCVIMGVGFFSSTLNTISEIQTMRLKGAIARSNAEGLTQKQKEEDLEREAKFSWFLIAQQIIFTTLTAASAAAAVYFLAKPFIDAIDTDVKKNFSVDD